MDFYPFCYMVTVNAFCLVVWIFSLVSAELLFFHRTIPNFVSYHNTLVNSLYCLCKSR